MRKVMDGLMYDTHDATCIARECVTDMAMLGFFNETLNRNLYRTVNGRYFFHRRVLRLRWFWLSKEEDIIPCTEDEAMHFCMRHSQRSYNEIWGDRTERA